VPDQVPQLYNDFHRPDMRPKKWSDRTTEQKMKKLWKECGPFCCWSIAHFGVAAVAVWAYFQINS
jgi:hypothetical protein